MFHLTAKIFWLIASPITLITIMLSIALLLKARNKNSKLAKSLLGFGLLCFLAIAILPIGHNLINFLETRHTKMTNSNNIENIIILGGAINSIKSEMHQQTLIGIHGGRIITALELIKDHPKAKIYFTGGNGALTEIGNPKSEADYAEQFFEKVLSNNDSKRITYERNARNTYENALYLAPKIQNKEANTLLITDAYHMPRSMEVFKSNGWKNIQPYPSGYYTKGLYQYHPDLNAFWNIKLFHLAMHELIGLTAYQITGKISLF